MVQFTVPLAVPFPPRSLLQVTWVTPRLSLAVPPMLSGLFVTDKVGLLVGEAIKIVGGVVSVGMLTVRRATTLVMEPATLLTTTV